MKIGFIGVGKLGEPCALEMVKAGHDVTVYDIKQSEVPQFSVATSIEELVFDKEFIFIAVPTPHHPLYGGETPISHLPSKNFDYSIVVNVLKEVNKYCKKDQLVVLISTVLPGTVRREFIQHTDNYSFLYNPYLIAMGSTAWDMVNPEMVIIGTEDGSLTPAAQKLITFYKTMMQNDPRYVVGTWDEAESIKIFYNTFISTKIGLVNMIQDVAEISGNINVDVVTTALAESTKRIMGPAYMKAGMGDAGACHPRDNIALRWLSQDLELEYDLFGTIIKSRELQAKRVAKKLCDLAHKNNLQIYIHGKSYKPGVPYIEGSYSLLIGYYVNEFGFSVKYIDPLTESSVPDKIKGVVLLAHHAPTTYSHTHVIGSNIQKFYCEIEPGSVVVDIWRYVSTDDIPGCTLIAYGNTR